MKNKYLFHPHEISFCGYSGSGKTTLISKFLHSMGSHHKIGYVKHDAHHFEMDKEGKDTDVAYKCGAQTVMINSVDEWAVRGHCPTQSIMMKSFLTDCDLVLIEGYKKSSSDKYLIIDIDGKILTEYLSGEFENVLGLIVPEDLNIFAIQSKLNSQPLSKIPVWSRNDVGAIQKHFLEHLRKKALSPLYGLILAGGKSLRMQKDKGALRYHNQSQVEFLSLLVKPYVSQVFVSCRAEQTESSHLQFSQLLPDQILGCGPMGGILSAQLSFPECAWMVVACDLPYLTSESIRKLVEHRNPLKTATAFWNQEKNWPEPLCTIWESSSQKALLSHWADGKCCPRKVLFNSNIEVIRSQDFLNLKNVNDPEEYKQALKDLSKKQMENSL